MGCAAQDRRLAGYADRFLTELPGSRASLSNPMRLVFGQVLFPYSAASPDLLARLDEALAQPDHEPIFRRTVIQGRDVAGKALRARRGPADRAGQPGAAQSSTTGQQHGPAARSTDNRGKNLAGPRTWSEPDAKELRWTTTR